MHFERIADKKRVRFITNEIIKNIPAGARVLDVGCGNGIISKAIAESGFEVTAIDASEKTIAAARTSNHHPLIEYKTVAAGELVPEPLKYSAIVCSEVLEHLHNPGDLLQILRISLTADGILIVTVPNGYGPRELLVTRPVQYILKKNNFFSASLNAVKKLLGYSGRTVQSSADDLTHIQFFSVNTLHKMARMSGFTISAIHKTNFVEQVFPYSLLTRRIIALQRLDCYLADKLPAAFSSGFMSVWKKA